MPTGCYCCLSSRHMKSRRKHESNVRIVHPGGRQELYELAIPVQEIMQKYPGTCIAKPGVFNNPEGCLLRPEEKLMPGNKYLVIPSTTAEKLKHRHSQREKSKVDDEIDDMSDVSITWDEHDISEESLCSAKDFYASKDRLTRRSERKKKTIRSRQPFVPPLPTIRGLKGLNWEPSLTSVQELSP